MFYYFVNFIISNHIVSLLKLQNIERAIVVIIMV